MKIGEKAERKILDEENNVVDTVVFTVVESGAFQYGNQTTTVVQIGEHEERAYDTRYYIGTLENFIRDWEKNDLRSCFHLG